MTQTAIQQKAVGCVMVLAVLIVLAVLLQWNWFFGTGREEEMAVSICAYAQVAYNEPCESDWLIINYMPQLEVCDSQLPAGVEHASDWARCLEAQGVILRIE